MSWHTDHHVVDALRAAVPGPCLVVGDGPSLSHMAAPLLTNNAHVARSQPRDKVALFAWALGRVDSYVCSGLADLVEIRAVVAQQPWECHAKDCGLLAASPHA